MKPLRAAKILADQGVDAEVIDLRSIRPLDDEIIVRSSRKTGRLVVADTSWALCGVSAEVAAVAARRACSTLKAPVRRVTPPDCPAPVSRRSRTPSIPTRSPSLSACLEVLKAGSSADKGVADVQATFAGPY